MLSRLSILMCARNAAATIERAVCSALAQGAGAVVLVDDWSDDGTAALARAAAGGDIRVLRPSEHRSLGFARHTAVMAAETEWVMWIDADDEALPGRAGLLLSRAEATGADIVFDDAELFDGATGAKVKNLPVPDFLRRDPTASRQFERNFIPGLGWPLVRSDLARHLGYDSDAHGVEDFDFCLRAIRVGARFAFCGATGYRQFAYPTSISRDIYQRRSDLARLYQKHEYKVIDDIVRRAGWSDRIAAWVVVAAAVFREDWAFAEESLADLASEAVAGDCVLEPDGPSPWPEAWRLAFQIGTVKLLRGAAAEALPYLERACRLRDSAESHNNRGVALHMAGRGGEATEAFARAVALSPGFVDAVGNLAEATACRVTRLPLRHQPARNIY